MVRLSVGSRHRAERPVGVQILNEPILICAMPRGIFAAFEDRLLHRLAPSPLGRCERQASLHVSRWLYDRTAASSKFRDRARYLRAHECAPISVERHGLRVGLDG